MNEEQFLLLKLMEECNEVSQIVSKTIQFGFENKAPLQEETNIKRIYEELNDLLAAVAMLNDRCALFNFLPDEEAIILKTTKVDFYHELMKNLGRGE